MDRIIDVKLEATPLHARLDEKRDAEPIVVRVTTNPDDQPRPDHALLLRSDRSPLPAGYAAYLFANSERQTYCELAYNLPGILQYLGDGDIVRINPRAGEMWVMYRRHSSTNSLLLTERCNSWCIMCSQPPKASEDGLLVRAWLDAIPLMSKETKELGFTGGEPTLLGDSFLELVKSCRDHLPTTGLHILSNGRLFNYLSFANKLAEITHPNLVVGIPLYSDLAWHHDYVVQAPGSFDQTIRGILNLARCGIRVEVRIVLHSESLKRLVPLAKYIARNLPFVEHVALMGLEPIGFAKSNFRSLWVDPVDYQEELREAVDGLVSGGVNVSIYNHQLCVLPIQLWQFARQSISDWKNVYLPVCQNCAVQDRCGGFFHSATQKHSRSIAPIADDVSSECQTLPLNSRSIECG